VVCSEVRHMYALRSQPHSMIDESKLNVHWWKSGVYLLEVRHVYSGRRAYMRWKYGMYTRTYIQ